MDLPAHPTPERSCAPYLVVVAGQSNAVGYPLGPSDLPPRLRIEDARVQIWNPRAGAFQAMRPGVNTGTANNPGAWGPEVEFAHRWRQDHPSGTLYLAKYARGETGLASDPKAPDWSPASTGDVWSKATKLVAGARAGLGAAPVRAVLWMQGETDAYDGAKAAGYRDALQRLIAQMRVAWGDKATRVYVGQINDPSPAADGWDTVRAVQAAVAATDRGVTLVETKRFARGSDGLHLSAQGQVSLGGAFYDAYRKAQPSPCG